MTILRQPEDFPRRRPDMDAYEHMGLVAQYYREKLAQGDSPDTDDSFIRILDYMEGAAKRYRDGDVEGAQLMLRVGLALLDSKKNAATYYIPFGVHPDV